MKQEYETFMRITPCTSCKGQRLKPSSLAVTVSDKNIYEMTSMSVKELVKFLADIELTEQQHYIGDQILKEIRARVGFLQQVGISRHHGHPLREVHPRILADGPLVQPPRT